MKIFKKFICLILCIAMLSAEAVSLTSCKNSEDIEEPESSIVTNQKADEEVTSYSVDVSDTNYEITILAPDNFTEDQVKNFVEFKNISSPLLTSTIDGIVGKEEMLVKKTGNGEFTITAKGGFNEGQSYQIQLNSEKLTFKDQNEEIRTYGVTFSKEDVCNIQLNSNIKRLHADELEKSDANQILKGDGVFKVNSDGTSSEYNTKGSFNYDSKAFKKGDIVAVYNGNVSNGGLFDESNEKVAYVEITKVNDKGSGESEYEYAAAEAEDIIFVPDMLPVKATCNAKIGSQSSITLSKDTFDYSVERHPEYGPLGLNEFTTVEPGDYIAFYNGTISRDDSKGETTAYAKILSVKEKGSDYVIGYQVVDVDDVMNAVEYHQTSVLSPDEIAEAIDEKTVQQAIIDQFNESKALSESAINLAKQAYETEEFKEAFGNAPIEELTFTFGDDEQVSLAGSDVLSENNNLGDIDAKGDKDCKISPDIIHFAGSTSYGTGIRIELYGIYTIKITSDKTKAAIKIDLTLFFEQEILLGLTVDVSIVWGCKWGFIYYPRDIAASGTFGIGSFTGIGFAAKATLYDSSKDKKKDDDAEEVLGIDWPEDIHPDARGEKIMKWGDKLKGNLDTYKKAFPGATATAGSGFESIYKGFIAGANKSWVDVCDVPLGDWGGPADPLHLISFGFKIDFVVSLQMNAAAGLAVGYERSYKYCFCFSIFNHDTESSSSVKDTDVFRGDAYLFGALGARAGFRVKLAVGLIDTRIDSVGLIVEAGAYAHFTGFLFISTEIKNSNTPTETKTTQALGAMLLDAGFYANLSVFAALGDGAIAYVKQVASIELPVFKLGETTFATDFAYAQDKAETVTFNILKGESTRELPTNIFELKVLAIENGTTYNDNPALNNEDLTKYFDISFSDPDLKYVFKDGKHCVEYVGADSSKESKCTLTLTYKPQRLQFNTTPPTRTLKVEWRYGITVLEFVNSFDDSVFATITKGTGEPITEEDLPVAPRVSGYEFCGWNGLPEVMPNKDRKVYAMYEKKLTNFYVEYYIKSRDNFTYLADYDHFDDILYAFDEVSDAVEFLREHNILRVDENYPGGIASKYEGLNIDVYNSTKDFYVRPGGTSTVKIYLERNEYEVIYKYGKNDYYTKKSYFDYGSVISFPEVECPEEGYVLAGWKDDTGKMVDLENPPICTRKCTFEAVFKEGPPVLRVEAQLKVKAVIGIYYWSTIAVEDYTFNKDTVSVRELIAKLRLPYYYSKQAVHDIDEEIEINPGGITKVTLRFE